MYFKLSELVQLTFEKTPLDNVIGGCGWSKPYPNLVNPLRDMLLVFEPCVTFVVNPNPNLGVQTLTLGVHTWNPTESKVVTHVSCC
jgi:hypothetical protein